MRYFCFQIIVLILLNVFYSVEAKPIKMVPLEFREGKKQFHRVCASCHGPEGIGRGRSPKLIQKKYSVDNFSNEEITSTILNGAKSGKMPPQKRRVKKREIKEIIKYIRYLQTQQNI